MNKPDFANYLKEQRKKNNLTIYRLSKLSKVSHSYISQLEKGEKEQPSPEILKKLAAPLGVMYSDLMIKAGYWKEADQDDIDALSGRPKKNNSPTVNVCFEELAHEQIEDLNGAKITTVISNEELARRFFDIKFLLEHRENVYYSNQKLSQEDREQVLDMLKILFRKYTDN